MGAGDWQLLETYNSQVEARVVESFLIAQNIEVQLFDIHTHDLPTVKQMTNGLRLMVRASDVDRARELLVATQRPSHLEIVGEEQPVQRNPYERWAFAALVALMLLVFFLTRA